MSSSRSLLVAVAALMMFAVVAGAVYLEILVSAKSTDTVWAVNSAVSAGDELTADNVKKVGLPRTGDTWALYSGDLPSAHRRAAHSMPVGTMLFKSDVLEKDMALVTLALKAPPPLRHGDTVDVYTQVGSQVLIVGRGLIVDSVNGNSCSVWVPTADEPSWVTLQAGNLAVFAARSSGVGVPQSLRGETTTEAVATLSGSAITDPAALQPTPRPSASPR